MTADFITRLADKGYTKKDGAIILADFLDVIYEAMRNGETVRLTGFGTFSVVRTAPKDYVNVHTGKRTTAAPHNKLRFRPGLALKRAAEEAP